VLAVNEMIPGLSRPAGSGPATARGAADVVLIVLMLVIMLSGDVELNPGPRTGKIKFNTKKHYTNSSHGTWLSMMYLTS
jgi:hypothetical protein